MGRINWTDDKLISRLKNNKSDRTRWENIHVLRMRPSRELFQICVELTKSEVPRTRKIGIDTLAQLGKQPRPFLEETLKLYFDLLQDETNPDVLMSLLYSIGHNNDDLNNVQIEKICSFIATDNGLVKEGLVYALLGINNEAAIETLIKLSKDKSSWIRNWATFGIGSQISRNNKNIREALWDRVNDKHQETKLEAIVGLAKRNDKRVTEIIRNELMNGEYATLLYEAILETKDLNYLPLLKQQLALIQSDNSINIYLKENLLDCIEELTKLSGKRQ
jgi:HEAT repeat protein